MNKKKLISLLALAAAVMPLSAQDTDSEYVFKKHAYIQVQGGAQYTLGETTFGDLLSPTAQIALGYQFKPWFGMRLAVGAWQSKGAFSGVKMSNGTYGTEVYKYNYVAPGIDFMFNLSNALCGWNPKRVFNVTAFVGGAANIAWGNDDAVALKNSGYNLSYIWDGTKIRPAARAGVDLDFRLSDCVSIGVEGNANMLIDKYNSKYGDNPDWYFNALVGLKFNLGKTYTKKERPAPVQPVEPVVEQAPAPAPAPVVEKKAEKMMRNVFFKINSSDISESEEGKVKELVSYLKQHDGAQVDVTGYADAGTGTDEINDAISAKRAEAVKKMLVEKYGISESRIRVSSKGSRVQPFADNDMNRVSICVAE